MPDFEKTVTFSNRGTRNEVRTRVLMEFLKEEPGCGKGDDATHYTYYVETLACGKRIYLTRPGFLNKQFDFVINVEEIDFNKNSRRVRTAPTHADVFEDFEEKKKENPRLYKKLYALVQKAFNCEEILDQDFVGLDFKNGYPADLLVLVTKWYFIEQDVAYWNYSGRNMFMSGIVGP